MPSDAESFGWVTSDSEDESRSNKEKQYNMVKLEKHSSNEDLQTSVLEPAVICKQEKNSPVKKDKAHLNSSRNSAGKLYSLTVYHRSNGAVSDHTRRNTMLLDNYTSNNGHLNKNTKSCSYTITDDDEIFLLQCPQSIDLDLLTGLEFLDRDKKKFKIGKMSYECILSDIKSNPIVTLLVPPVKDSDYKLRTVNVQGTYFITDKIKSANEIEVIEEANAAVPFPNNLKERHPLFGASYKSLIKIPSSVKEKFAAPVRKHPKVKKIKVEAIEDEIVEPVVKKSKKRKAEYLEDDEQTYCQHKKIKKEDDAWATETSIELNLFNKSVKSKRKSK